MGGQRFTDKANGWMMIFRFVTPALLGVVWWIVVAGQTRQEVQVTLFRAEIIEELRDLKNDYYHQLVDIKERLASLEARFNVKRPGSAN